MFLNLFYLATSIIVGVAIFIIVINFKSNRIVNVYFVIVTIIAFGSYLLLSFNNLISPIPNIILNYRALGIIVFPSFYLYFKKLQLDVKGFSIQDGVHFVLPIVIAIFNLLFFDEKSLYPLPGKLVICALMLFYLIKSFGIVKSVNTVDTNSNNAKEKSNEHIRKWMLFFMTIVFLGVLRLILTIITDHYFDTLSLGENHLWLFAIVLNVLFLTFLANPKLLFGIDKLDALVNDFSYVHLDSLSLFNKQRIKKVKSKKDLKLKEIVNSNLLLYLKKIQEGIENNIFRNKNITLTGLSAKLNIPQSHLYFVFKYHSPLGFFEFIKRVQISDAQEMIRSGYLKMNTMDTLAPLVGFSSYSTFYKTFLKVTNCSPTEFKNSLN